MQTNVLTTAKCSVMTSVLDMIGNTPMLPINLLHPNSGENFHIYAKAEIVNPSGSVKDRIAKYIVEQAEKNGELRPGMTMVEATSGNTGISFAQVALVKGYKMIVLMPEHMSIERVKILRYLGADVRLTPQAAGFLGAVAMAEEMGKNDKNIYLPRQFTNINNPLCHKNTTGAEILAQIDGKIDAFIAGVGTGGTLMGVGEAIKPIYPNCMMVAVEPDESAVMSGETKFTPHKIQGIGDGFIPEIVDMKKVDRVARITSNDAIKMARTLAAEFGLMVGISAGANVLAALNTAKLLGADKTIVTVLPDRVERYFSTELFNI